MNYLVRHLQLLRVLGARKYVQLYQWFIEVFQMVNVSLKTSLAPKKLVSDSQFLRAQSMNNVRIKMWYHLFVQDIQ